MIKIRLEIEGPVELKSFLDSTLAPFADFQGIYFWVEEREEGSILNYIGKHTNSIYDRNRFHAIHQVSGIYPIPAGYFKDIDPARKHDYKGKKSSSKGLREEQSKTFQDKNELLKVISAGFSFRDKIKVFYAKYTDIQLSLSSLEAHLIYELGPYDNRQRPSPPSESIEVSFNFNDSKVEDKYSQIFKCKKTNSNQIITDNLEDSMKETEAIKKADAIKEADAIKGKLTGVDC